jgi:cold-inducible RNA-binding protein
MSRRYGLRVFWGCPKTHNPSPTIWRISLSNKLYVGNLDSNITTADLEQMFVKHGIVISALVCTDKDLGHSKGFGFVEMGSDQEAKAAIDELNGKNLDGRNLIVNEANPLKVRKISEDAKVRNRGPIPRGQRF